MGSGIGRLYLLLALATAGSSVLFLASPADAVSTRHFTLDDAAELAAIFDEDFKANARSLLLDNYARELRTTSLDISSLSS